MQKIFIFFLLMIFSVSCSPVKPDLPDIQHKHEHDKEIYKPGIKSIEELSHGLQSLKSRCYISLTIKGKPEPKIKGILHWMKNKNDIAFRLTGFTPINTTAFDALYLNGKFLLAIPSDEIVMVMAQDDLLPNKKKFKIVSENIKNILIPWSATDSTLLIPCKTNLPYPSNSKCLRMKNSDDILGLEVYNNAPLWIESEDVIVTYAEHIFLSDGTPYPQFFLIKFTGIPLEINISLKETEIMNYTISEELFNPSSFFQMPFYPLSKYLDEIAKQIKETGNK